MAHQLKDRVGAYSTTSGVGALTLLTSPLIPAFQTIESALATNDTGDFFASDGIDWEVFLGTKTASNVLTRTTILASSNGNNAVSWSVGTTKEIVMSPAARHLWSLPAYGGNFSLVNGKLALSVDAGALTIAIKTREGNDPSPREPVFIIFRGATLATGDFSVIALVAATSVTLPSGATLGVTTGVQMKIRILGFNDGGTFRLGAINSSDANNIYPLREAGLMSATAVDTASDSLNVAYASAAVTSKAYRVLGVMEWTGTGHTAGTWTAPTSCEIQRPGIPLPGDVIQARRATGSAFSTSSPHTTFQATGLDVFITPSSVTSKILVGLAGTMITAVQNQQSIMQLTRDGSVAGVTQRCGTSAVGTAISGVGATWLDAPYSVAEKEYEAWLKSDTANAATFPYQEDGVIWAMEISS